MLLELKRIRGDWGPLTLFMNGEMVPNIKTATLRSEAEDIPVLTVEFYCCADPEMGVVVREGVHDGRPAQPVCAPKNVSDSVFLKWVADRMVHVYGENCNADFILTLRRIADETKGK